MRKLNKNIGILIGSGTVLSGIVMAVILKKRRKKLSDFEEDDFDFELEEIEEDSCIKHKFDTENLKDDKYDTEKEEIDYLVDEYLEYESKTEAEKQENFRSLSANVMDILLKEVISMSENLKIVKKDIDRIGEAKALVQELENCKEEIISLWEHLETLSNMREEHILEKDRG